MKVHLDTDIGSDTDDLCALAMLLGWDQVELVGVTTSTDPGGRRAGYAVYALALAGHEEVPVVAGAEGTLAPPMVPFAFPDYWPEPVPERPSSPGAATDALAAAAEGGATVVAIGPYTNLAMLEVARPGAVGSASVVVMGGHVTAPREGYPPVGIDVDFNVQQDRIAASIVLRAGRPLVVPVSITVEVALREAHLARLRRSGRLGTLIADQAEAHARDERVHELARRFERLPDDLLNFQHDPLACAVALGWDGVEIEDVPTELELRDDRLRMTRSEGLPTLPVVTSVDAQAFEEVWLAAVERASAGGGRGGVSPP
jgi:purine nucleosidase